MAKTPPNDRLNTPGAGDQPEGVQPGHIRVTTDSVNEYYSRLRDEVGDEEAERILIREFAMMPRALRRAVLSGQSELELVDTEFVRNALRESTRSRIEDVLAPSDAPTSPRVSATDIRTEILADTDAASQRILDIRAELARRYPDDTPAELANRIYRSTNTDLFGAAKTPEVARIINAVCEFAGNFAFQYNRAVRAGLIEGNPVEFSRPDIRTLDDVFFLHVKIRNELNDARIENGDLRRTMTATNDRIRSYYDTLTQNPNENQIDDIDDPVAPVVLFDDEQEQPDPFDSIDLDQSNLDLDDEDFVPDQDAFDQLRDLDEQATEAVEDDEVDDEDAEEADATPQQPINPASLAQARWEKTERDIRSSAVAKPLKLWQKIAAKSPTLRAVAATVTGAGTMGAVYAALNAIFDVPTAEYLGYWIEPLVASGVASVAVALPIAIAYGIRKCRAKGSERAKWGENEVILNRFNEELTAFGIDPANEHSDFQTNVATVEKLNDAELVNTDAEHDLLIAMNRVAGMKPEEIPFLGDNLDDYTQYCFVKFSEICRQANEPATDTSKRAVRALNPKQKTLLKEFLYRDDAGAVTPNIQQNRVKELYETSRAYAIVVKHRHEGRRDKKTWAMTGGTLAAVALSGIGVGIPALVGVGTLAAQAIRRKINAPKRYEFSEKGEIQGVGERPSTSPELRDSVLYDQYTLDETTKDTELDETEKHWAGKMKTIPSQCITAFEKGRYKDEHDFAIEYDKIIAGGLKGTLIDTKAKPSERDKKLAERKLAEAKEKKDGHTRKIGELKQEIRSQDTEVKRERAQVRRLEGTAREDAEQSVRDLESSIGDLRVQLAEEERLLGLASAEIKAADDALIDIEHPKPAKIDEMSDDDKKKKLHSLDNMQGNNALRKAFAVCVHKHWAALQNRNRRESRGYAKKIGGWAGRKAQSATKKIVEVATATGGNILVGAGVGGGGALIIESLIFSSASLTSPITYAAAGVGSLIAAGKYLSGLWSTKEKIVITQAPAKKEEKKDEKKEEKKEEKKRDEHH